MNEEFMEMSLDEIVKEYSDVIEELKVSEYYSNDRAIARMIKTAILAGVDMYNHNSILEVIVMAHGRRYQRGKIDWKKSNYDIMQEILDERKYLCDPKRFPSDKDYNDFYFYDEDLEELEDYDEAYGPVLVRLKK